MYLAMETIIISSTQGKISHAGAREKQLLLSVRYM